MSATHLVALSGGKDSTAMALRLAEVEPRAYKFVCTPTGNELPAMLAHWDRLEQLLGQEIVRLQVATLVQLARDQAHLPNFQQRWCTRKLKLEPYARVLAALTTAGPVTNYVGLRADEPDREGGIYLSLPTVVTRHPLREWGWGLREVLSYLEERGVCVPPRTDCALCFFQRLGEWWDLWHEHPALWAEGEQLEADTGHTFRTPGRDTWPVALRDLRVAFEGGRIPKDRRNFNLFDATCRVCSL